MICEWISAVGYETRRGEFLWASQAVMFARLIPIASSTHVSVLAISLETSELFPHVLGPPITYPATGSRYAS